MTVVTGQPIPVRVYQSAERVMLSAPMPGLEPEDILVRIDGRRIVIHGEERGPHQRDVPLAIGEWAVGPYDREVDLPEPVDGATTNATYGNGVLVLSMPKVSAGHVGTSAEFRLITVGRTHGERVGHVGREALPHTTEAHWQDKHRSDRPGRVAGTPGMTLELSADEIAVLGQSLEHYLADFRREVAGTENPDMRHRLQRRQNALEGIVTRLAETIAG